MWPSWIVLMGILRLPALFLKYKNHTQMWLFWKIISKISQVWFRIWNEVHKEFIKEAGSLRRHIKINSPKSTIFNLVEKPQKEEKIVKTKSRVGGAGGFGGAQAPPSFSDLFSKNFQNLQNFHNFIFFYLIGAPHKKFASAHPEFCNMS